MPSNKKTINSIPLYVPTQSLKFNYVFNKGKGENATWKSLEAADTHAKLKAGVKGLLDTRKNLVCKNGNKMYKQDFNAGNIATAAITLLYTDTYTEEGYLGEDVEQKSFDIPSLKSGARIVSVLDYYGETYKQDGVDDRQSIRSESFLERLTNRIDSFGRIDLNYDLNLCVPTVEALGNEIAGTQFHKQFHHSEQALATSISSPLGIKFLANSARSVRAAYVYGMVLDLYTEILVCRNCNITLLGMQNSGRTGGFLCDLGGELAKPDSRIEVSDHLMLHTRVTADRAGTGTNMDAIKLMNDKEVVHSYNPAHAPSLFQADSKNIGVRKIITDNNYGINSYAGAFFTATNLTNNKNLEASILT
jgi:hypothetical protein